MRIGFITHWFDPEGGAAAGPGTIARALADRGHEVHVVTGFPIYPGGQIHSGYRLRPYLQESMDGMTVHRFPIYPSHDSSSVKRFANYASYALAGSVGAPLRLPKLDSAFVYSSPATAALPGISLQFLRGVPFVVQIQDLWPQTVSSSGMLGPRTSKFADSMLNPMCDFVYRRAHRVAVTSPGMATHLTARGVPPEKLTVVPNWADEQSFRPDRRSPQLAKEFGLVASTVVMYAGNLGVLQNLETVIAAAALLRDLPDLQIAFVGAGVMDSKLRRAAADQGLSNVVFVPPQPFSRMSQVLALGDAQLVTLQDNLLFRSTLPSKLQANLAAGRPVIGAVAGDAARVITASGAGFVVPPGHPQALADAIRRFYTTTDVERQEFSRRALSFYTQTFSRAEVVARIDDLLRQAAERKAA